MGMAASQARYLGIQARKTNVEYEGQQVNQQRTALANQSANLFRRLLTLDVPVPPDQTDYKTSSYTFSDATSSDGLAVIDDISANSGTDPQTYTVNIKRNVSVPQYDAMTNQEVSVIKDGDTYKINLSNGTQFTLNGPISPLSETYVNSFNELGATEYENSTDDTYYKFTNPSTNATYFINATQTDFDPTVTTSQPVDMYTMMAGTETQYETINNATLGKSEEGIYTSIYWTDDQGSHSYNLTPTSEYDDAAYDAAMNKYNYDKELYEKEVADINAKTQELQEEDRTLELRLTQLDTEQQALQTELESVKKVIDKNIDNVFKTFQ